MIDLTKIPMMDNAPYLGDGLKNKVLIRVPRHNHRLTRDGTFSMDFQEHDLFLAKKFDVLIIDHTLKVMALFKHEDIIPSLEIKEKEGQEFFIGRVKKLYDEQRYLQLVSFKR